VGFHKQRSWHIIISVFVLGMPSVAVSPPRRGLSRRSWSPGYKISGTVYRDAAITTLDVIFDVIVVELLAKVLVVDIIGVASVSEFLIEGSGPLCRWHEARKHVGRHVDGSGDRRVLQDRKIARKAMPEAPFSLWLNDGDGR
jgi:hypothetical protein